MEMGRMPGERPSETLGLYHNFIVLNLICFLISVPPNPCKQASMDIGR